MAEIRGLLSVCDKQLHYGNQIISRGLSSVEPSLALDYMGGILKRQKIITIN